MSVKPLTSVIARFMNNIMFGGVKMDQVLRRILIVTGVLVGGAVLLWVGILIGRNAWGMGSYFPGSMMTGFLPNQYGQARGFPGHHMDSGMMVSGVGSPWGATGIGPGMMGGYGGSLFDQADPLTLDAARTAVEAYIAGWDDDLELEISEIMIFDNHAYAQIIEEGSGIGAFEVLVDPITLAVTPEHGPNMMWNLKYGMHGADNQGLGMMMGGYGHVNREWMGGMMGIAPIGEISVEMTVSPEQAVEAAQRYLDQYLPGAEADDHADPFYGYYTIHILDDGEVVGMLSVNGYSSQVFPHTWHGDFIEMSEGH
jgi:hypothetical protein